MKKFDEWWFPDHEEHLLEWMRKTHKRVDGRLTYQYGKYLAALGWVQDKKGMAIDVGSHIGLWAWFMARDFESVACFEPMPAHIECWRKNMAAYENATLHEVALGDGEGMVKMETRTADSSGDTGVVPGLGDTPMKKLDSFHFQNVRLIKIDCEGFEEFVLRGGVDTLLENRPCIVVEQKRDMSKQYGLQQQSAVAFLKDLGAKQRAEISGDFIMSW